MALGKQIRRYRSLLGWRLEDLSEVSGVDIGTISALEQRDSSRSQFFIALANAFGVSLEVLANETIDPRPNPPVAPGKYAQGGVATHIEAHEENTKNNQVLMDIWTHEAIKIMSELDADQRQAMVARMREFKHFLGPPRDGQTLHVAG